MGGSLCALRQSCFGKLPDEETEGGVTINGRESTSELFLKKPKHLKSEDKGKGAMPTLEQWMLASPCISQDGTDASRLQGLCRQTAKVSPMSHERIYSTLRGSFSSEFSHGARLGSSPRRSQSGKRGSFSTDCSHGETLGSLPRRSQSGKRVSFKLPDDDDIHIFYVCDETDDQKCEV